MTVTINGTTGVAGVDGTAATPAIQGNDTNTGIFFPAADTIAFAEGGAESMRLDSNGNLGLGITPSPWSTSNSTKAVQVSSRGSVWANVNSTSINNNWYLASGDVSTYINTAPATRYVQDATGIHQWFYASSGTAGATMTLTEAMRIDSSGNFLVGTTTNSGGYRLNVTGNTGNTLAQFDNSGSTTNTNTLMAVGANNTTQSALQIYSQSNGAFNTIIYSNGNIVNRNNSYGAISDIKNKENIVDATPKLDKLNQVRVVNYNLIGEEQKQIGVIAQELEQIFPSMIDESPDTDKDGNDLGTTTKQVKYSVFVPILIKALQEQQAIITDLKSRIEALEQA